MTTVQTQAEVIRFGDFTSAAQVPPEQRCGNCRHWSRWLTTTGDCMEYAKRRQDAMARYEGNDFSVVWPVRSAYDTQVNDTCANWKATDDETP